MKTIHTCLFVVVLLLVNACSEQTYSTNGETIYKTGKNLAAEKVLDKQQSRITIVSSCVTCHGKSGDKMNRVSIKYSALTNPNRYTIPYTDSLFFRFLDHDLKSDGTKANIGVVFKMSDQDKKDLWEYLKTL
jgi:cytochrome c553